MSIALFTIKLNWQKDKHASFCSSYESFHKDPVESCSSAAFQRAASVHTEIFVNVQILRFIIITGVGAYLALLKLVYSSRTLKTRTELFLLNDV